MESTSTLERAADVVRADLRLDALLTTVGVPHLVGSAALGLMVWPDLDMTVVCDRLDVTGLHRLAGTMVDHPRVRGLSFRNDTGAWNVEPATYPDGVYWGIDYRDGQREWNVDIWFVTDAERQPDLRHLRELAPRLTPELREAILAIKGEWAGRPEYRGSVTSFDIYDAVLDHDVRNVTDFERHLERRT